MKTVIERKYMISCISGFYIIFFTLPLFSYTDITKHGYELYQDVFINGKTVQKGVRNCKERYDVIKSIVSKYKRPITVLDLGASQGYFSLRIAHDFPHATCVMVEGDNGSYPLTARQLSEICQENTQLNNIIFLRRKFTLQDLQRLGECEHFDVVLAFNIIHHFPQDWNQVAQAIFNLGDTILIENPPVEPVAAPWSNHIRKGVSNMILAQGGRRIAQVERHTSKDRKSNIFLMNNNKTHIFRTMWFAPRVDTPGAYRIPKGPYVIKSNFHQKHLVKTDHYPRKKVVSIPWKRGINLMTYKMLNGVFPRPPQIKQAIRNLSTIKSNDWMPNNMIMQGRNIEMIDTNDPAHDIDWNRISFSQKRLQKVLQMIDIQKPKNVKSFFEKELAKTII